MVSLGQLKATSIGFGQTFNWIWMIELVVSGILVLFFLFYFNRLFATLVSYALRAYAWHQFRAYIDIQSLQLSFLAGRIFFKGIRYHGENETVCLQNGYITWNYWLPAVRQVELATYKKPKRRLDTPNDEENESSSTSDISGQSGNKAGRARNSDQLKARITAYVAGLEWFVYNRTPVYDAILQDGLGVSERDHCVPEPKTSGFDQESVMSNNISRKLPDSLQSHDRSSSKATGHVEGNNEASNMSELEGMDSLQRQSSYSTQTADEEEYSDNPSPLYSFMLRFLPIFIECQKGSISLANENTRAILITTFVKARGHVDASGCGPQDIFRQLFDFEIERPVVQMKPNPDFRHSQLTSAERALSRRDFVFKRNKLDSILWRARQLRSSIWHSLKLLIPYFPRSSASVHTYLAAEKPFPTDQTLADPEAENDWHGLNRYVDEELNEHEAWSHIDYARFSTLLDCPSVSFRFYWDIPGEVVADTRSMSGQNPYNDINHAEPPAYGMDISIRGGTVHYGPWTDRLRAEIQTAFLPSPYRSAKPATPLTPGSVRQSTKMVIHIQIEDEVTLRVPTKESSKDWQWKGRVNAMRQAENRKKQRSKKHFRFRRGSQRELGPDVRPFGWMSFSVARHSTVRYEMDLVPGPEGYRNQLEMDLKATKAMSSINHGLLWRCEAQQLKCDVSNPLGWNSLHEWSFDIQNRGMEMFLLRDHMFLLVDLIEDFTAGPKPDYMSFVPFKYHIGISFENLKLYLNSNDSNIIDNPSDLDDNAFLILGFQELRGSVDIPLHNFAASQNSVHFMGTGRSAYMDLTLPQWNTLHAFVSKDSIATLKDLKLDGSYNYCATTSPLSSDSLILGIEGAGLRLYLHGFLIRYFKNMKENYFGEDLHFKTLEEYQEMLALDDPQRLLHMAPAKKENDLDTILSVRATQSCALMPMNLYSRKQNIRYDILLAEADMRFTNYYMDLEVKSSPIEASLETIAREDHTCSDSISNCQIFIDGASVFGHRFFGAPPTEPPYVCNWDIDIGDITGELSPVFLQSLISAIQSFMFTLDDDENALPAFHIDVVPDVTFLTVRVGSIEMWLVMENAAVSLKLPNAEVLFDDWAGSCLSKQLSVYAPDIVLAAVDSKSAMRHHENPYQPVETLGYFRTALNLKMFNQKSDSAKARASQQHHIHYHDRRTHRAEWLLRDPPREENSMKQSEWASRPATLPLPLLPEPLFTRENRHAKPQSWRPPHSSQHLRRERSFLSFSASSSSSKHSHRSPENLPNKSTRMQSKFSNSNRPEATNGEVLPQGMPSGPWNTPHFTLLNVKPDLSNVPQLPSSHTVHHRGSRIRANTQGSGFDSGNQITGSHTGFVCHLSQGLVSFVTPELLLKLAVFVRRIQPSHPTDVLDAAQIQTVKRIMRHVLKGQKPNEVIDFYVYIPVASIRVISQQSDQVTRIRDQYDITLERSHVTGRIDMNSGNDALDASKTVASPLIHAAAQAITVQVSETAIASETVLSSAHGSISDLTFWMGRYDMMKARLQLRSVEFGVAGSHVKDLASLIQHTTATVDMLVQAFENINDDVSVKLVVYYLASADIDFVDPTFLTRPSYVLRCADQHLRLDDSWKVLSRLRHIYSLLPKANQDKIIEYGLQISPELPQDYQDQILSRFDQWRSWDHGKFEQSSIVEVVFGPSAAEIEKSRTRDPFFIHVYVGGVRISIDSGSSQSTFGLADLSFSVSSRTSKADRAHNFLQSIRIYSYISQLGLKVEWELIQLIGDTFEQFRLFESTETLEMTDNKEQAQVPANIDLFFVLGIDNASIMVKSPNTGIRLASQNLCLSGVVSPQDAGRSSLNITISSAAASAKLRTQAETLLGWRILFPNVYVSDVINTQASAQGKDLRLAATCRQLRFVTKKDLLTLVSVARHITEDEVPYIRNLVSQVDQIQSKKSRVAIAPPQRSTRSNIALFLEDYKLKFSLLPSFSYIISGRVARTSIVPRQSSRVAVNFDLKTNFHYFRSKGDGALHAPPAIEIPPINGAVMVQARDKVTDLDIRTAVEQVTFKTAAVRACIDALNRPDLARMVVDLKASVERLKSRISEQYPRKIESPSVNSEGTGPVLAFTSHTTITGLSVHLSAPSLKQWNYQAELDLIIGFTSLCFHNRTKQIDIVHEKPQFDINFHELAIGVRRTSARENVNFGKITLNLQASGKTESFDGESVIEHYRTETKCLHVDLHPETAILVIDIVTFIQDRLKSFTLNEEARNFRPLRRLTIAGFEEKTKEYIPEQDVDEDARSMSILFEAILSIEINDIQVRWLLPDDIITSRQRELEDLVFSIQKVDLKKTKEASARLAITNLQLQMAPKSSDLKSRSSNSALLPELVFKAAYVSTKKDRRFAFQAAGKALDLRLASDFILPATTLQKSLAASSTEVRNANAQWISSPSLGYKSSARPAKLLGRKGLASLLLDANFAGAIVTVTPRLAETKSTSFSILKGNKRSRPGRYGQVVQGETATEATLRSPGIALKVQYQDDGAEDPELSAQFRVAASSNVLYPSVVPLILEISSSIKETVGDDESAPTSAQGKPETSTNLSDNTLSAGYPNAILGKCKLNAGLWIQRQEFSLSCQPIAQVAATAKFDDIFLTMNTVQSPDQDRFFSLVSTFNKLSASVQHVYSRESTATFEVESIVISAMNSKHVSSKPGISAILNVSPMRMSINAKQLQDFLLFREIWYPPELRQARRPPASATSAADAHVQRYQQATANGSFLWNAVVSIEELKVDVDLGQGLGKSAFVVEKLWASSKKSSDLEQNLCIGFDKVGIDSTGRMSGFIALQEFRLRSSIRWPQTTSLSKKAPLIQGAIGFSHFRIKAAFDYQPFAVADISSFEFLMYNVHQRQDEKDRLVGILSGDKVQIFCISATAAQVYALYQAFERLIQEKQEAYENAIRELDRYLRRKSVFPMASWTAKSTDISEEPDVDQVPFSLLTDVVVSLREVNAGIFPATFFDNQILKLEASNAQARFAVATRRNETHSILGMTLGELRVALSTVGRANTQALGEVSIADVIQRATNSRGGTILKVPKLVMAMSTWQTIGSNRIEYTFKSVFEGKVDVGWNYSRISFIRGMWNAHSRALAQRLGKPVTPSAVRITAEPKLDGEPDGQEKITAVVNVPQSKFEYVARVPPIIDTPQLRDLGEATPSVELFGLHRDRLPNVTHQIIVMPLLEVAREVEDAYSRILGSA